MPSSLPTTGLTGTPVADHQDHHLSLHEIHNHLVSAGIAGDIVMRIGSGTASGSFARRQRHYVLPEQTMTVTHSSSGSLTFAVTGQTRAVKVNASANVTGITVTGMDLLGVQFSEIDVLLVATANITVDLSSGSLVYGTAPASMTAGQSVPFTVQRWNF